MKTRRPPRRSALGLTAIASLSLLLFASAPSVPSVPGPQPTPPSREEIVALEELARWVRDDHQVQVVSRDDVTEALRQGRRSFELFRDYTGKQAHRDYLEQLPYGDEIFDVAERNGLDGLLVAALVEVESSFRPRAESVVGAVGLMQVMPDTGALYGVRNLTDPSTNLAVGSRYFSDLLELFSGDLELALAAYNAGPGAVKRWGGVPPYPETRRYVEKVLQTYIGNHRRVWDESGAAERIVLR